MKPKERISGVYSDISGSTCFFILLKFCIFVLSKQSSGNGFTNSKKVLLSL